MMAIRFLKSFGVGCFVLGFFIWFFFLFLWFNFFVVSLKVIVYFVEDWNSKD